MMNSVTLFLLISSVVCSTARAVFSKKLGVLNGSKYGFYITQTVLFAASAAMIFVLNFKSICRPSVISVILAVAYGIFTVSSQWTYTAYKGPCIGLRYGLFLWIYYPDHFRNCPLARTG